jgi:hypothetical protein
MDVSAACAACFAAHRNDCSGFAKAVATTLDVPLDGMANDIVNTLRSGGNWQVLTDGIAANTRAAAGDFVIGGMRGDEQVNHDVHGHVVVVVGDQPLAHGRYPAAWWGSLGGQPGQDETVNFAWTEADRDRVTYAVWTG